MSSRLQYTSVINALAGQGQWEAAMTMLDDMTKVCSEKPTIGTYCAVMDACGNGGEWEKALGIYRSLEGSRFDTSSRSFNSLIKALEKGGQSQLAESISRERSMFGKKST